MLKNAISEPLDFKIFWRSMPPDPYKPCAFVTHFQVPPRENMLCRPTRWSPGLPSLCQYTHGINTHWKKALMLNKFGMKSS